jgi:ATP-dependent Lon protease
MKRKKINKIVDQNLQEAQRLYFLSEQMKVIQKELGNEKDEFAEIEEKLRTVKLSDEAREKVVTEFNRLKQMNPSLGEASIYKAYIDFVLGMPWGVLADGNSSIKRAEKVLDEDHYGLKDVKERILEYISIQNRTKKPSRTILCLIGAPGVGKTSLGKSIAKALRRPFMRIALGGVSDESEIRGHKKTYIGAMPGRIISAIKKAKVSNPVILLDEIDKISKDFRGDPSAALLEVLDPQQNYAFQDNYMDVGYNLSEVIFICTSNSYIQNAALADRMEGIYIPGYTSEEKILYS